MAGQKYDKDIRWWNITDRDDYVNRRSFLRRAGATAGTIGIGMAFPALLSAGGSPETQGQAPANAATTVRATPFADLPSSRYSTDEKQNTFVQATTYNNFYEFGSGKRDPSTNGAGWTPPQPFQVQIRGHVSNPMTLNYEDILGRYRQHLEERIYRLRCVEAWSMVIPWVGFPLHRIIADVSPTSSAKYVKFITYYDDTDFRSRTRSIPYPYVEGLRMDEAMNDLTLMTVGMYGGGLHNSNGPPLRVVVPWKYGFKSGKSVNVIEFTDEQPQNTWNVVQPSEYGFFSNVNPERDHPRWSQKTETRIGEQGRRLTEKYNGYGEWVAPLYTGMDLIRTAY